MKIQNLHEISYLGSCCHMVDYHICYSVIIINAYVDPFRCSVGIMVLNACHGTVFLNVFTLLKILSTLQVLSCYMYEPEHIIIH